MGNSGMGGASLWGEHVFNTFSLNVCFVRDTLMWIAIAEVLCGLEVYFYAGVGSAWLLVSLGVPALCPMLASAVINMRAHIHDVRSLAHEVWTTPAEQFILPAVCCMS